MLAALIGIGGGLWILVGIIVVAAKGDGGWLIMITNKRNTRATWVAIPALVLTWLFWPWRSGFARFMFLLSRCF